MMGCWWSKSGYLARLTRATILEVRDTKRPPRCSEATFSSGGLFARRAPALGSPRRRGFLSADRYHTDLGGRLELGGGGGVPGSGACCTAASPHACSSC